MLRIASIFQQGSKAHNRIVIETKSDTAHREYIEIEALSKYFKLEKI